MKIGIVTYCLCVGGVEKLIFNLAKSFLETGHKVDVIESEGEGQWKGYFIENKLNVRTFRLSFFTIPLFHIKKLAKVFSEFDVLLINDAVYAQAGLGLVSGNVKAFPVLHNSLESMITNALSNFSQWNKIICVSPALKEKIDCRIITEKSVYIPNGAIPIGFNKRDFSGKIKILYVGRIEDHQKGVLLIPQIAKLLLEKKIEFQIEIIGNGPSYQELENLVAKLNIKDYIHLKGILPHSAVIDSMRISHFLLLPSNYEGFGIVIIEAMSCGLIPIVSYLPGYTDICIKEGITGFFGIPGKYQSFVAAIEKALKEKQVLNQISKNAFNLVSEKFSISAMSGAYLKVISEDKSEISRNNKIDYTILPKYPKMPIIIGRIINRINRTFHLNH